MGKNLLTPLLLGVVSVARGCCICCEGRKYPTRLLVHIVLCISHCVHLCRAVLV